MAKDNPDYFKVGGRSGGPAGSLRTFKQRVARDQARIARLEKGRLPHERRPPGSRPPPPGPFSTASPPERTHPEPENHREGGETPREQGRETDIPSAAQRPDFGPPASSEMLLAASTEVPTEAPEEAPTEQATSREAPSEQAPIPGTAETGTEGPGVAERAPRLLRGIARRYPHTLRFAAKIERGFDDRIRRAVQRTPLLSRLERPVGKALDALQDLGAYARRGSRDAGRSS